MIKTDFSGSKMGMQAATDFGRVTSSTSHVTLQDGYQIPLFSVGAKGAFLQYRFDGESDTSSTDGFEIYSVGAIIT